MTAAPGTAAAFQSPPADHGATYTNPVYAHDFADPFVLRVGSEYYGYATNAASGGANIQVIRSSDLASWRPLGDALPRLPPWATPGDTWAPAVLARDGGFVLYYAAQHSEEQELHCISRAVADSPAGPYRDDLGEPWLCQTTCRDSFVSSIDPYPFVDEDGSVFLVWTTARDACGNAPGHWVQRLSDDGLRLEGEPAQVIVEDQYWESGGVENPAIYKHQGAYYHLYSANLWTTADYAMSYAVCEKITGPCRKPQEEPAVRSNFGGKVAGPGGGAFFTDHDGELWLAYHAWTFPTVGYPNGMRSLHIDRVGFENGRLIVDGPTEAPQPLP
jgi:beta-xylosidase